VKTRILIVEDDRASAELLKDGLLGAGYAVVHAPGAEEALLELREGVPDLMILDVNLGGMTGFQLCDLVRGSPATAGIPILMLTSRSGTADKVSGLRRGADDYVVKPFVEPELLARVEALLRRGRPTPPSAVLQSGDVRVDLDRREVFIGQRATALSPLEFDLLVVFLKSPGRAMTYAQLAAVWTGRTATRHTLTVTVARLRERLGDAGDRIEALPGVGYKWRESRRS
jgi:DNA-binding response OmpR family regulator